MRKLFLASIILGMSAVAGIAQAPASIETKLLSRYRNIEKWSRLRIRHGPERETGKALQFRPGEKYVQLPVVIEDEETPQGRVTNARITYRFNGSHFVKAN